MTVALQLIHNWSFCVPTDLCEYVKFSAVNWTYKFFFKGTHMYEYGFLKKLRLQWKYVSLFVASYVGDLLVRRKGVHLYGTKMNKKPSTHFLPSYWKLDNVLLLNNRSVNGRMSCTSRWKEHLTFWVRVIIKIFLFY